MRVGARRNRRRSRAGRRAHPEPAARPRRRRAHRRRQAAGARRPKSLLAELSYQDANGETLTVSSRVPLWPSAYVVGIKPDGWLLRKDALKFQTVVLDVTGKPAAGVPVRSTSSSA
jgi:hypothetical protein